MNTPTNIKRTPLRRRRTRSSPLAQLLRGGLSRLILSLLVVTVAVLMASGMVLAQQVGSGTAAPEQTTTPEQQTTSTVPSYTVKDLGTLPGRTESGAFDINNTGQVVGYSGNITYPEDAHAFLYSGGQMQDLGTLPGGIGSIAYSVNDSGQVVGVSLTSNETKRAFLYSDAQMYDLNDLIPGDAGWTLLEARGINTSGQIVGTGVINGQTRAFLATPTTTPPSVTSTVPNAIATEVAPTANVKATFSEEMDRNTINGTTFKLFKKGTTTQIAATVSYNADTDTAKLDPINNLRRGVAYKVVVTTWAKDAEGNRLDQDKSTTGLQQKR